MGLTPDARKTLRAQLLRDEGLRLQPYTDSVGKLTIGVGRNLTDTGITRAEALVLLEHDLTTAETAVCQRWPWAERLDPARLAVLVNMALNLGPGGLGTFRRALAALQRADYARAADELLDSQWAAQVGDRARRLAAQLRTGEWT
jgi:lysozyme